MSNQTVKKTTLENGIRIVTKNMPYVRSISMGVWVHVGARDEKLSENGLSHFIEHMIFKGTGKRSSFQIAKEFDAIGGHTNAFTTMEHTCYHAKVVDSHLTNMVDILSDIFLNSVFDATEVEKERFVILQEIGMVEDTPDEYIHVLFGNNFWSENSLGRSILGSRENIISFNSNTIKSFFTHFYQPERIVISFAGKLNHDEIVDLVEPLFSSIRSSNGFPERITPQGCPAIKLHQKELEQVHLCLGTKGISITDPQRYALSLLNTILGGNMSSRLFQEIRENRGLAYSVFSFISSHVDTGLFGVYAGIDPNKTSEAIEVIIEEMNQLKTKPVNADELHDAVEHTKGSLMLASESTDNQMVRLAQNEIHFGRHIPLLEVLAEIESVTTDEILHLAESLFQTKQMGLTVLGPIKKTKTLYDDILKLH
ncbi:MAG: insulinase family protein [Desulfobacterales bacterium]|nr:insulinase family protein [Desulfobacterales bacterium]